MDKQGEFEIGLGAMIALVVIAGYAMMAWETHEKNLVKLKALDKGCTPELVQKLTE